MEEFRTRLEMENYFGSLTQANISARATPTNITNISIIDYYLQNIRKPTVREQNILEASIRIANTIIQPIPAFRRIPWNIMISNDYIESGFPHTHVDYIIIPHAHVHIAAKRPQQLAETLIHEKIHVFQRKYPCECHLLYTVYWRMSIKGLRSRHPNYDKMRANPDIDDILYNDNATNTTIFNTFADDSKPSLGTTIGDERDHPHEIMAYVITHIVTNRTSYIQPSNVKYIPSTIAWMNDRLVNL